MTEFLPNTERLQDLVQPVGGVISYIRPLPGILAGLSDAAGAAAQSGLLGQLFPPAAGLRGPSWFDARATGSAVDADTASANTRSVAEALERYATMVVQPDEFIVASQRELGGEALDLGTLPACSARELDDGRCPIGTADPDKPIRWIKGLSLHTGRTKYLPLVISHLNVQPTKAENFWLPISTGVAAHFDPSRAIVSAICEVVERDALSLMWLANIAVPEILFAGRGAAVFRGPACEHRFFDITTDIGLPTLLAIELREGSPRISQLVSAACGLTCSDVHDKVLRELVQLGRAGLESTSLSEDIRDFVKLAEGATYMGHPDRRRHFDFLLNTQRLMKSDVFERKISVPTSSRDALSWIKRRFEALSLEVVIVDLTTDELRDIGLWVVRAVVPGLMPMSTVYRARYLGHPRLYEYAGRTGRRNFCEADVTAAPLPFA